MPEQNKPKRISRRHKLSEADEIGQIVEIGCSYCRRKRLYRPADLARIYGDVTFPEIEHSSMSCEQCGRSDYVRARLLHPTAGERQQMRLRRLVQIKWARRFVWADE